MKPVRIVHVTPHLGGGIGKSLAALAGAQHGAGFEHAFVLLERPEKTLFLDGLKRFGCPVATLPDDGVEGATAMLAAADVVQLEWWNHPATLAFLCRTPLPPLRLLAWCHVSGLGTPVVPPGLIDAVARFVFTSPCSLASDAVARLDGVARQKVGVVASGVGLAEPTRRTEADGALRVGYVGSLNFSKLHPRVVDYLAAIDVPGFTLRVWGDVQNREALLNQCRQHDRPDLIAFEGFSEDVVGVLASLDVFAYLLNPTHYGTGENALVEAMSAGVVPVVLDNPAERAIVEHGRSGLVVDSPAAFAAGIRRLADDPAERRRLGENARDVAMTRFTARAMGDAMAREYCAVLAQAKRSVDFAAVLGASPADWFLRCQAAGDRFPDAIPALAADPYARHGLGETSKGSLQHFASRFPDDPRLAEWTRRHAKVPR